MLILAGFALGAVGLRAEQPLYAAGLIPRVRELQPRKSLLTLADWFLANRRTQRAWEIVAFGLAHNPRDHALLVRAARINWSFSDPVTARIYALKALEVRPGDSEMLALVRQIQSRSVAPSGETTAATPAPVPAPESTSVEASATTTEAPLELDDKLRILSLMRLVQSAMTAYNLRHPKHELKALDLAKLREEKLIPTDFDPPDLAQVSWSGGSCEHPGVGSQQDLQAKLGDYRKQLAKVEDWLARGHPHEALRDLKGLIETHGSTRRIRALEQKAWRAIDPAKALEMAAAHQVETPGLTIQKGLELWRDGGPEQAAQVFSQVAQRWPDSPHIPVARHLAKLAGKGLSIDFMDQFYQQRARSLAATEKTTPEATEAAGTKE